MLIHARAICEDARAKCELDVDASKMSEGVDCCAICLGQMADVPEPPVYVIGSEDEVVELVSCRHRFHGQCIEEHMKRSVNRCCPLCRDGSYVTTVEQCVGEVDDEEEHRDGVDVSPVVAEIVRRFYALNPRERQLLRDFVDEELRRRNEASEQEAQGRTEPEDV